MAKKRFKIRDKQGNPVDYDISAASVTIDIEGKSLEVKLSELVDAISRSVKSVTFNGNSPTMDSNGNVNLGQQVQPDWNEGNINWPSFIRNKPSLSRVATSGSYNDLSNKPTIPEGVATDSQMSDSSDAPVKNRVIKAYVDNLISGLVNGAPQALDTLNELSAALGNDANFAATITQQLAGKISGIKKHDGTPIAPDENGIVTLPEQTEVDMTDYYDKDEVDAAIANKLSNVIVNNIPAGSVAIIDDTTTGGSDKVWSAGMGKKVAGREATDRQRIDAIVAILKKAVFTDVDQTAAFAALDALADGIDSISFNASSHKFTNLGDTFTLSVVTDPAGKTAQVTWVSSNTSVATVNGGVVTAVADGNAVITATTTDGKVAVCSIVVETIVITGISLNKSTLTLNGNDANETLVATTVPAGYESGVQWSSSDPSKATVDNNGKVTAVANTAANTPVIITASIGGQTATCQVTVTGVMQTFHISVGTLTNVTIEDGQGNAITNGQTVMEGSSLAITFEPAASHVIDALSVVMGSTTLSLADATDGTGGAKVITIASVSGDIVISASATYQAKEYMDGAVVDVEKHGMFGGYVQNNALNCKVVPLDFGKFYKLSGYNWKEQNGSSVYSIGLVKSDGNGGYTNIVPGTDVTKPANLTAEDLNWGSSYIEHAAGSQVYTQVDTLYFTVLPQSAYNSIDKVYLVINTYFSSDASKNITFPNLSVKEFRSEVETMLYYGNIGNTFAQRTYPLGLKAQLFELDFGKSYSYSGYTWQEQEGANGGYDMSLVAVVDGIMRILQKSEVQGVDSFFSDSTKCLKVNPSASGSFTVPLSSAFDSGIERVYLAINLQYGGDTTMDFSDFTLTENS